METILHNYYELTLFDRDNNIIKTAKAYNEANSKLYLNTGYISKLVLTGSNNVEFIEPAPGTLSTYFTRVSISRKNNKYYAMYKAVVEFINMVGSGIVTGFRLTDNRNLIISDAPLVDIEGEPIILKYEDMQHITVNVYIFFESTINDINISKTISDKYKPPINYIKYFQPSNSIMCGCCGTQQNLLEIVKRTNRNGDLIIDGYLPFNTNKYIGFTKSPMPLYNSKINILYGGINNYILLTNKGLTEEGETYKNVRVPQQLKGLITGIVFPSIGVIDLLSDEAINGGPLRQGILKGSKVTGQNCCYIPQEYLDYEKSIFPENFEPWSITKNAFYDVDKVIVRRLLGGNSVQEIIPETKDGITMLKSDAFFSNGIEDERLARSLSFSQHVPMSPYYCGAEGLIPCSSVYNPTTPMVGIFTTYYGYDILYQSEQEQKEEGEYIHYYAASYIVLGEVVTEGSDGNKTVQIFPCTLEYSYNGQDFYTAISTEGSNSDYKPYTRIDFGTIAAPVWRLKSSINGVSCYRAGNTTYSDPYIAELCHPQDTETIYNSSYDPMFIFVGFSDSAEVIVNDENYNPEKANKAIVKAREKNSNFLYPDSMEIDEGLEYYTKTPYLYHENDSIFFTGELDKGYRKNIVFG